MVTPQTIVKTVSKLDLVDHASEELVSTAFGRIIVWYTPEDAYCHEKLPFPNNM
jgi:hypothetical protein